MITVAGSSPRDPDRFTGGQADLVLLGGPVITVDPHDRVAEAVAVTGNRITAVGTGAEIRPSIGPGTRVVELAGAAVLPGINDSHLHASMLGAYWPNTWLSTLTRGEGLPAPRELADHADRIAAIERAFEVLAPLGVTSYTEPGLGPGARGQHGGSCDDGVLAAYRELAGAGRLRARVTALMLFGELDGPSTLADLVLALADRAEGGITGDDGLDPRWLRVAGVKLFADGIPPMHNAWMFDPYIGGGSGGLMVEGADDEDRIATLRAMVGRVHRAGLQLGVHATGDRAVAQVVAAMADAMAVDPRAELRHYIIHGDAIAPATLRAMAADRIGVNAQPGIYTATPALLDAALGEQRVEQLLPLRSALDAGVPVCLSSDGPVVAPDWRRTVAAAVLRETPGDGDGGTPRVRGAEQRITVREALRAYTIDAAWQDHAEEWKGSIEVGKVADLCVLAADPLAVEPRLLPDVDVLMTVLDGRIIFER